MIITSSSHGRTSRDCRNLVRHLLKEEDNDEIRVIEFGNTVATTLAEAIDDMQRLRDGGAASVALHHFSINPSSACTDDELREIALLTRTEMDPDLTRPFAVVIHSKPRNSLTDLTGHQTRFGPTHAHLVLGHVDFDGRALKDGRSKQRTEMVARLAEYMLTTRGHVEPPVIGRHWLYAINRLQIEAPNAAQWLTACGGNNPPKPLSAMSSNTRQRAQRLGVKLPHIMARIRAERQSANTFPEFLHRLHDIGVSVIAGNKPGVFIVVDAEHRVIGALDRVLRVRRAAIKREMEIYSASETFRATTYERGSFHRAFTPDAADTRTARRIGDGSRSNQSYNGFPRAMGGASNSPKPGDGAASPEGRRGIRARLTNISLRLIGNAISRSSALSHKTLATLHQSSVPWDGSTDIWGIPIERKEYVPKI